MKDIDREQLELPATRVESELPFPVFVKTFRIAVTGDVQVTALELKIINDPDFQRLRGVRQLGSAVQVYPTALHTRFDHSLGTLAMVDRMIAEIRDISNQQKADNPDEAKVTAPQRAIARLYGLLHDVTHVPFGHTLEDELGIFHTHDTPDENKRFEKLLGPNSSIGRYIKEDWPVGLGEDGYKRFRALFFHKPILLGQKKGDGKGCKSEDDFIYDLVSNTVCADLLDYLRRDSYFCNLGVDFEYRFLKYLFLKNVNGRRRVVIRLWKEKTGVPRRDVITDLTRLLRARYMIAERVYFHHAKIVAGTMIGRAALEAKSLKALDEERLCDHTDDTLIRYLATSEDVGPISNKLARAYQERRLHKVVEEYQAEYFSRYKANKDQGLPKDNVIKALSDPETRLKIEDRIASEIGATQGDVLIYVPESKMNKKYAAMLVEWDGGTKSFGEVKDPSVEGTLDAIYKAHERLWTVYLILERGVLGKYDNLDEYARSSFEACLAEIMRDRNWKERKADAVKKLLRFKLRSEGNLGPVEPAVYDNAIERATERAMEDFINKGSGASPHTLDLLADDIRKELSTAK